MKPTIICLTPVKNEAWVLDIFLKSTSLWADYIIIADQMSTDGSREIALKYPKVILIDNKSESFNEPERQKLLINEARKISGKRLLITLDADEIFSPEFLTSKEWDNMLMAKSGTIFRFQWANFLPDLQKMWYGYYFPWGYMDDGAEHTSQNQIHSARIPLPNNHTVVDIQDFKVIHLQYTDWSRMASKHRYYQCMEVINYPDKSGVDIYRQYHHMIAVKDNDKIEIPKKWFHLYQELGIDFNKLSFSKEYWFDKAVLSFFDEFGIHKFSKVDIWNTDWRTKAKYYNRKPFEKYKDPRNIIEKIIIWWLKKTQKKSTHKVYRHIDRAIKNILKF